MSTRKLFTRPTLDNVLRRAHLSVALIAVVTAGITLTAAGLFAVRVYSEQNLRLVARSMSYTVEAAVVFSDAVAAREALVLIGANEDIDEAEVRDIHGKILAQWKRPKVGTRYQLEHALGAWIMPASLSFPIIHGDSEIGQIRLTPHSRGLLQFLLTGLACVLACLLVSTMVAVRLSRRMETGITGPLRNLAEIAHRVRRDRSFELRVPPAEIAELNQLNDDFNALLDELEAWQNHLQKENASLSHRANHDSLTGLSNRAFLETELERAVAEASLSGSRVAVLFLDSDRFKEINDTYGHASGDEVLVTIAARIKAQLREGDLVARLGGDEFAILLKPLRSSNDAVVIADKIIEDMHNPIPLPTGTTIVTSLTIGVAVFPDHARDPAALLGAADEAMYRAKQTRRGTRQTAGNADALKTGADTLATDKSDTGKSDAGKSGTGKSDAGKSELTTGE